MILRRGRGRTILFKNNSTARIARGFLRPPSANPPVASYVSLPSLPPSLPSPPSLPASHLPPPPPPTSLSPPFLPHLGAHKNRYYAFVQMSAVDNVAMVSVGSIREICSLAGLVAALVYTVMTALPTARDNSAPSHFLFRSLESTDWVHRHP